LPPEGDSKKPDIVEFAPTPQGMFLSMQYHFGPPRKPGKNRTKVADLDPASKRFDIDLKVVSVKEGEAVLGDETGIVTCITKKELKVGQHVELRSGYTSMVNGHLHLRINKGARTLDRSPIKEVNQSNDVTKQKYELVD